MKCALGFLILCLFAIALGKGRASLRKEVSRCCKEGCDQVTLLHLHDDITQYASSHGADKELVDLAKKVIGGHRCQDYPYWSFIDITCPERVTLQGPSNVKVMCDVSFSNFQKITHFENTIGTPQGVVLPCTECITYPFYGRDSGIYGAVFQVYMNTGGFYNVTVQINDLIQIVVEYVYIFVQFSSGTHSSSTYSSTYSTATISTTVSPTSSTTSSIGNTTSGTHTTSTGNYTTLTSSTSGGNYTTYSTASTSGGNTTSAFTSTSGGHISSSTFSSFPNFETKTVQIKETSKKLPDTKKTDKKEKVEKKKTEGKKKAEEKKEKVADSKKEQKVGKKHKE